MARPLNEISDLVNKYRCPVLCAGDVFDKWNPPPELINFAIEYLPVMYAIPGQHDLPYHELKGIQRSAFWTLVQAGIINLVTDKVTGHRPMSGNAGLCIHGFAWGVNVESPSLCDATGGLLQVCLHHAYRWVIGTGHNQAKPSDRVCEPYPGYDVVITGDNHIAFDTEFRKPKQSFFNCGSLMRRHSDQYNHPARVGLIMSDGTVRSHYLDISKDVFNPVARDSDGKADPILEEFLTSLRDVQAATLDYKEVMLRAMDSRHLSEGAKQYIREAMEQ